MYITDKINVQTHLFASPANLFFKHSFDIFICTNQN